MNMHGHFLVCWEAWKPDLFKRGSQVLHCKLHLSETFPVMSEWHLSYGVANLHFWLLIRARWGKSTLTAFRWSHLFFLRQRGRRENKWAKRTGGFITTTEFHKVAAALRPAIFLTAGILWLVGDLIAGRLGPGRASRCGTTTNLFDFSVIKHHYGETKSKLNIQPRRRDLRLGVFPGSHFSARAASLNSGGR